MYVGCLPIMEYGSIPYNIGITYEKMATAFNVYKRMHAAMDA